jgi:hypothetical protein
MIVEDFIQQADAHLVRYWDRLEDGEFVTGLLEAMRSLAATGAAPECLRRVEIHDRLSKQRKITHSP